MKMITWKGLRKSQEIIYFVTFRCYEISLIRSEKTGYF